jgi:catechol 2,3-dioxygenase-like lactoylglutathione lyase family enzyme
MEILSAVPTFLVADVAETARWYEDHLGFVTAGKFPPEPPHAYASLQREGAEIMLLSLAGYEEPDLSALRPSVMWDAYIRMRGVNSLYEALGGSDFIKMPLTHQSYGDWEFEVRDPNGYILVFGGEY